MIVLDNKGLGEILCLVGAEIFFSYLPYSFQVGKVQVLPKK